MLATLRLLINLTLHPVTQEKDKMKSLNVLLVLLEAKAVSLLIGKKQSEALWNAYMTLLLKCKEMMNRLRNFDLPSVKPFICDPSDAGPGVGVSNLEVRFRDAELARLPLGLKYSFLEFL